MTTSGGTVARGGGITPGGPLFSPMKLTTAALPPSEPTERTLQIIVFEGKRQKVSFSTGIFHTRNNFGRAKTICSNNGEEHDGWTRIG